MSKVLLMFVLSIMPMLAALAPDANAFSYVIYHGTTKYNCWESYNPFQTHCSTALSTSGSTNEVSAALANEIMKNGKILSKSR